MTATGNLNGPNLNGLGRFEGKTHLLPVSVYYEDTDLSGFVYHANYLRYMERGRTEFFRLAGISKMAGLEHEEPFAWAIRRADIDFRKPARLDDVLTVKTRLTSLSGARLHALQQIVHGQTLLVEGRIEACLVTLTGKPRRLPEKVRTLLTPFLYEPPTSDG
jgi:acyl-CoA thioester hydrolase